MPERERYRLTLEALPDSAPVPRRLARVLKGLLRTHGFRCLAVEELQADHGAVSGDRPSEAILGDAEGNVLDQEARSR